MSELKTLTSRQYHDGFEACIDNEGQIRFLKIQSLLCVCIKSYNKWRWTPYIRLSKANKLKYCNNIANSFTFTLKHMPSQLRRILKNQKFMNRSINEELKYTKVFLQKKTSKITKMCEELNNANVELKHTKALLTKKTCIVDGCPGMCARDFDEYNKEGFDECFCCKKKQELECPICYDTHSVNNMARGKNCSHHICWKCYGMSCYGGNQIKKCPLCRADFNSVVAPLDDDGNFNDGERFVFDSDDELVDEEW